MGNTLGVKKKKLAKVMKITGETFKIKTPIQVESILSNHPGHSLMESEAVKHFGVRAKPLKPQEELKPGRLYFLIELPKLPEERGPRRVRSDIQMSAKDRLESLMLARRSSSDLTIIHKEPTKVASDEGGSVSGVRVKMRVSKAEVDRLMAESNDRDEAAKKIYKLCLATNGGEAAGGNSRLGNLPPKDVIKPREKRVGFRAVTEGEVRQLVVAS